MASLSEISALMDAAAAAIAAGDPTTAVAKAQQALAKRTAVPDGQAAGLITTWRPSEIQAFIKSARESQKGSTGVQQTLITRQRPSL